MAVVAPDPYEIRIIPAGGMFPLESPNYNGALWFPGG